MKASESKKADEKGITVKKSENFSEWYIQAITKSEFIDYTDVSGAIAFRPSAYAVWQIAMEAIDKEFKKVGIENVYFPLFIPEKYLNKEKEHVKGFTPEVAWVTQTGNTKLDERLAVRPTSEAIMYPSFSKWVRSWRDLPLRYNQWNSVVRWEFKNPVPLMRNREFLWNEGHSAYASEKEVMEERDVILGIYLKALKELFALPGIPGQKSDKEKFAGGVATYSVELLMPDGWAIQGPDWHFDGQNFAKAYDIKFLDKDGKSDYAWQSTYAITTRMLGIMVATHGDDKGLVLPPKLAQTQVVIVPIFKNESKDQVLRFCNEIYELIGSKFRVKIDDREGYSPGYKFSEWELKGVPVRLEIGPKEVDRKKVVMVRRDTGAKVDTDTGDIVAKLDVLLNDIHKNMYEKAEAFLKENTHQVTTYSKFKKIMDTELGIISAPWCGDQACEDKIKEETGAKITNIPFEQPRVHGKCVFCGKDAKHYANFAKSY